MSNLEPAKKLLKELETAVETNDVDGGMLALADLKVALLDFPMGMDASEEHISISMRAMESGALFSVIIGDLEAFSRNVAQLKPYYDATATTTTTTSSTAAEARKNQILGLNLMHLLVENSLSEFHAELELLTEENISNNPLISFPITIERQLMVGSYDEVLNAKSSIPDPSYAFFMENLIQTVRDSIADCLEVSYKTMTMDDAVKMMKLDSKEQLLDYIEEYRDDWIMEKEEKEGGDGKGGNVICFQPNEIGNKASDIPSMKLISQSLTYATELERII